MADAQAGLRALAAALGDWHVDDAYLASASELTADWNAAVDRAYHLGHGPLPAQSEVIGAVNDAAQARRRRGLRGRQHAR